MGLLDGIVGSVLGNVLGGSSGAQGGANPLMNIAFQLMQQQGGLQGLIGNLSKAGLGEQAKSWVGTGENMSVSPDMLKSALGSGVLGDMAAKAGMSEGDLSSGLASMLPDIINKMTPNGQVESNSNDMISQALGMLMKR
jgi:uncharacterized protein YidB (DUF937 family)